MDEKATLQEKLEELKRLNRNRFDYVLARSRIRTTDGALQEIGMSRAWYYKFSEDERQELERLADELHYQRKVQAELILENAVNEAANVKVDGLSSKREDVRQDSASEILDRVLGKAKQTTEITGEKGGPLKIVYVNDWRQEE